MSVKRSISQINTIAAPRRVSGWAARSLGSFIFCFMDCELVRTQSITWLNMALPFSTVSGYCIQSAIAFPLPVTLIASRQQLSPHQTPPVTKSPKYSQNTAPTTFRITKWETLSIKCSFTIKIPPRPFWDFLIFQNLIKTGTKQEQQHTQNRYFSFFPQTLTIWSYSLTIDQNVDNMFLHNMLLVLLL